MGITHKGIDPSTRPHKGGSWAISIRTGAGVCRHLFTQRYLLSQSCRTREKMQLQAFTLFAHLKWNERDSYLPKVHSNLPVCTKQALRNSCLSGQYSFFMRNWCVARWTSSREMFPNLQYTDVGPLVQPPRWLSNHFEGRRQTASPSSQGPG